MYTLIASLYSKRVFTFYSLAVTVQCTRYIALVVLVYETHMQKNKFALEKKIRTI